MKTAEDVRITIDDVLASGHCATGTRAWFRNTGLDFRKFMTEGIPAVEMLATKDGVAEQVVEATLARLNK